MYTATITTLFLMPVVIIYTTYWFFFLLRSKDFVSSFLWRRLQTKVGFYVVTLATKFLSFSITDAIREHPAVKN